MAKINHNNFLDTVNNVISNAKKQEIVHLYAEDKHFEKGLLTVKGRAMYHFGTTSYLGLDQDSRLKKAAIEAIQNYGTQFPLSKTYISHPLYAELEAKIKALYGGIPAIITKNSTLGHMAVIPSAINDKDAVILDHQVHWSVQNAAQMLKLRGVSVQLIRHNNLEMLRSRIEQLYDTVDRIWYMVDGVYSMFGDYAPLADLQQLARKYPKLYLYIDDVHGMSWIGKNGMGYAMSVFKELPENCLLFTTLSKSFGASGGVLICKNDALRTKIKNFGGPLTFSAQLEPAPVAAAIASANIHLSPEIYQLQDELQARTQYFNSLMRSTDLPVIHHNSSPVFYIGTGLPATGYNFVKRLFNAGFFVNLGLFPAVPVTNTGVRITISRNNDFQHIDALVQAMEQHYSKALADTHTTQNAVRKLFKMEAKVPAPPKPNSLSMSLQSETSIAQIDREEWNQLMGHQSVYDWQGLRWLELVYTDNPERSDNWDFHYLIIRDTRDKPILATFFTRALWKVDMLAPESVSQKLEEQRLDDPYYLTNTVLSMGSLFTEGAHLYLDSNSTNCTKALMAMLEHMRALDDENPADMIVLRDFSEEDALFSTIFHEQGFIKIKMPDVAEISKISYASTPEYLTTLSSRSRRHFRNDIQKYEPFFDVKWLASCDLETLDYSYELYKQVKQNNLGLNTFLYPKKLFTTMNTDAHWEFLLLYLNPSSGRTISKPVGMMCCYKNLAHSFVPVIVGMDYKVSQAFNVYRQLLYQTIKRAWEGKFQKVDFGLTAAFEKRKVGAKVSTANHAFVQAKDNYFMEYLMTIQAG